MEERRLVIPRRALSDLERLFIPPNIHPDSSLCLSVIVEDSGVNIREFGAYLNLIDSTYGRLTPKGINSYSMRQEDQLKITTFEHESTVFNFIERLANADNIQILILIGLLLKYLPGGIEKLSAAYKNYEEGRLLAERRKILRRQIREDADLIGLPDAKKKQLTILVDELLVRGRRFLPKASRFAVKYVRHVKIKVLSKSGKNLGD